jgi:putative transposase
MTKIIGHQEFNTASHCVYRLSYHIIFCPKFRRHILTPDRSDFLFDTLRDLALEINCEISDINGEDDHVHFILEAPPSICLSSVIGMLKSKSASALLGKYGSFFWGKHARTVWSSGFFVCSTGGAPLEVIKQYIANQNRERG